MFFTKTFGWKGIHPEEYKKLTNKKRIESANIPNIAYIPVSQHIGKPAKIIVEVGQKVEEGQIIAEGDGFISANIHSSIPGNVIGIEERYISVGKKSKVVMIELEGEFRRSGKNIQLTDWMSLTKQRLLDKIKDAGIVGLGGATFPTHVKMTIPDKKEVDCLIINSAECEPYLTCDHRLLIDKTVDLLEGINILKRLLNPKQVYIGVEINKRDAIKRLHALCDNKHNFKIVPLKVKYPQGDEKQLIKAVTGRVVPVEKLPLEVGCVVLSTATVVSIKEAVINDKPLIDRVVTVTGRGVKEPKNLKVRLGTLIRDVIDDCGGLTDKVKKIVVGGPMMGFAQMDQETPVSKGTSGILCLTEEECGEYKVDATCINCGKCINSCSFGLMPTVINKFITNKYFDKALDAGLMYCKECGACSWICPAKIPLVQNLRLGKDFARKLLLNR